MLNLDAALKVPGWMSDKELEWLAKAAKQHSRIAEVGCWQGRTTVALADNTPGSVTAVDTWKGSEEHQSVLSRLPEDWLYQTFLNHVGERTNVRAIRKPSIEAAAELFAAGEQFDMVFIDAAHDYENVKADIIAWRMLLVPGGLLCGHDFDKGRDGVVQAVRELIPVVRLGAGSIWCEV